MGASIFSQIRAVSRGADVVSRLFIGALSDFGRTAERAECSHFLDVKLREEVMWSATRIQAPFEFSRLTKFQKSIYTDNLGLLISARFGNMNLSMAASGTKCGLVLKINLIEVMPECRIGTFLMHWTMLAHSRFSNLTAINRSQTLHLTAVRWL